MASVAKKQRTFAIPWWGRSKAGQPSPDESDDGDRASDGKAATVDVVEPTQENEPTPVPLFAMFRYSTRFEIILDLIGLVGAVGAGAAQPLMSLFFGSLTQDYVKFATYLARVQAGDQSAQAGLSAAAVGFRHSAANNAIYLSLVGVGMFFCTLVYMTIWVWTGEVNSRRVREQYLRAVLRQDVAFFDKVGAGEVATRIQTDTHLVQQGISEKMALSVHFVSAFFTGYILAYARSWRLALALTSILPFIGITGALLNKFVSRYMQLSLKYIAEGGSVAEEVISTIRTAQAFGTQKILAGIYDGYVDKAHTVSIKSAAIHGSAMSSFFFAIYAGYALAFSFGTTLINEGHANGGIVVNVFLAILIGSFSLALLAPEMQAVTQGRGAAAKLFATIDRVPAIDSSDPSGLKPEKVVGEIAFEDVVFNYPSRPTVPVVRNLSVTFPAGHTTAIVGASGSGKSTVVSLVERFYDPLEGAVKLDGVDIRELNIQWLRSQIGLVSQEPTLFATTIRGNVAHGLINTRYEHAPEEEKLALIREACVKANADGFVSKLPEGYDTLVGERGFLLSGGQKQRIAIARAIVSDPRILLLDEATSALDTQSEGVVQDALDKAAAGRTTITIAHRLSTIKDAHQIFVMGEGRILQRGTHNELLRDENGAYARLVQAQKLREQREALSDAAGDATALESKDIEKVLEEEEDTMDAKTATRSLASSILERRRAGDVEGGRDADYGSWYLLRRMGSINKGAWANYLIGSFFAVLTGAVYPCFGIVFAKGIVGFSLQDPKARRERGDMSALWFFVISLLAMACIGLQNYLFGKAAANLTAKVRSLSFRAILRQDIEYFDKDENSTGNLTATLSDNPQKISGLAGITLGAIVQSISTVISGLTLGFIFIWKVAFVALACTPLMLSSGYIRLRVVVLKDQANKKSHAQSAHLACEAAGAIRTVASLTREEDCCMQYSQSLEEPLQRSNRTSLWANLLYAFSQSATLFVIALIFWYGARLVSFLEFSTFQFFIGLMSSTFGIMQAGNVFSFVPDMSSARGAASDVIKLIDSIPEIDAESTAGKTPESEKLHGQIRFKDVHFRYPTRPAVRVLRGFSLTVQPGTFIALVGASGCGKSTIIQLIERFYDPLAGEIYFDGEQITELNVQEYRKQISLVSQEPTLYAGTIRFNIMLGAIKPPSEVTQEELDAVCRDANILDFIQSLPNGFETEVGGKGSQLSGGQKQRIAIARALLRNPKVLLLDEATSALDSSSEKVVQDALDKAARGRTTIAIAHRLASIQNADCIYFIKEGKISEAGTHDQLLALRGDYYEYTALQNLSQR